MTNKQQTAEQLEAALRQHEDRSMDIRIGRGVVPFARAHLLPVTVGPSSSPGAPLKAGWVLPGGERTLDRQHAEAVAKQIDRLMTVSLGL